MNRLRRPVPIAKAHRTKEFDCGELALNRFLRDFASRNQKTRSSRTYVCLDAKDRVLAYYSLAASSIRYGGATDRLRKGLPRHDIPMVPLTRLAVDRNVQGKGLGSQLLRDALPRAVAAAHVIGARGVLVHAKHDAAKRFYEKYDFEPLPGNRFHLVVLMKDLQRLVAGSSAS